MNKANSSKDHDAIHRYRYVKSLGRGLALLEDLARSGWAKPADLAVRTGVDRSTIYRLAGTLIELGYVVRRREDGALALTQKVRTIADGVRGHEAMIERISPHLANLTADISWPSDLALLREGVVTIEDSTHSLSPITFHRATINQNRSLVHSALGRAIMMMLTPQELTTVLDISCGPGGPDFGHDIDRASLRDVLNACLELGYASAIGAVDPKVSAIAVGFRGKYGVIGAVNIVFFRHTLSPEKAAAKYLQRIRTCIEAIESELK